MSFANRDCFTPYFLIWILWFLEWLPCTCYTTSTMLCKGSKSRYPCLFRILGESTESFSIALEVSCGLFTGVLYWVEKVSFYCWWLFPWKGVEICKCFFSIWDEHVGFVLCSINMVYYINLFPDVKLTNSEINFIWSWCILLFIYCWFCSASILLTIFACIVRRDTGLLCSCDIIGLVSG